MKEIWMKSNMIGLAAIALSLIIMCAMAFWQIVHGKSQAVSAAERQIPIYCVETVENRVALSFDVATGTDDLQQLLDILKKHQVKATFFLVGSWVRKWPEAVQQIYNEGHELASHANHHVDMTTLNYTDCIQEVRGVEQEVYKLTGYTMNLFRPPYGAYNNQVIQAARDCGYEGVQWSVDSLDWKEYGVEDMLRRVLEHEKLDKGAILLFHNNTKYTAQALDAILTGLSAKGYALGTVSDLILKENYIIDSQGCQRPAG